MDLFAYVSDRFVYPSPDRKCTCVTYDVGGVQCAIRHGKGSDKVIVYVHGNETTLFDLTSAGIIDAIALECNATVVAPEFPGYGDMANKSRGHGHVADACISDTIGTVVGTLKDHGASDICLMGRSIGSAIVIKGMSSSQKMASGVSKVVLISPFTSLADMFPSTLRCMAQQRLDNVAGIQAIRCPVLLLHGSDDELVPSEHTHKIAQAKASCQLHIVEGMHHVVNVGIVRKLCTYIKPFLHSNVATTGGYTLSDFDVFKPEQ